MNLDCTTRNIYLHRESLCPLVTSLVVVVVGVVVAANVYDEPGGVVSHHVQELPVEAQLVGLALAGGAGAGGVSEQRDHAVHPPDPGLHHGPRPPRPPLPRLGLQLELVGLQEGGDAQVLAAVDAGEVRLLSEGAGEAERGEGRVEVEDGSGVEPRQRDLHLVRHQRPQQTIQSPLAESGLQLGQTS